MHSTKHYTTNWIEVMLDYVFWAAYLVFDIQSKTGVR
jgi:hypothetical protein